MSSTATRLVVLHPCLMSALDWKKYPGVHWPHSGEHIPVCSQNGQSHVGYTPTVGCRTIIKHPSCGIPGMPRIRHRISHRIHYRGVYPGTLDLISEKDELVPGWMGTDILNAMESKGGTVSVIIRDALHENVWGRRQWVRIRRQYTQSAVIY